MAPLTVGKRHPRLFVKSCTVRYRLVKNDVVEGNDTPENTEANLKAIRPKPGTTKTHSSKFICIFLSD